MNRLHSPGVAARVLGLSAVVLCLWACDAEIQHGLKERHANQIVSVLRQAGIRAEKTRDKGRRPRFTVRVPSKQAARAFKILQAKELPPRQKKGVPELFGKSGLVPTATEQHVKMVYALGSEIARTLEQMEGVLSARVHLVVPPNRGLTDLGTKRPKPRASVFLKVRPGSTPATVTEIKNLVAGAVADLSADGVSVIIRPGAKLALSTPVPSPGVPMWLKAVALAGCVASLLLAVLVVWLALRLKRAREQTQAAEGEWTGSDRRALQSTGSASVYKP
jgi:type III secretion protein J